MAESSWRTRRVQWKHYFEFTREVGLPLMPCSSQNLCLYIAFMARRFKYVTIISNYVSAHRALHKMYGLASPPPEDFLVKSTLQGARRLLGDTCFSSDPILPKQLLSMYGKLNMRNMEDYVFWTTTILCFRGLLRKSSVCKGQNCLLLSDLQFHSWGVIVRLRKSKTIQYKERVHVIPIAGVGGPLCVVTFLRHMYQKIPVKNNLSLFGIFVKNVYKPSLMSGLGKN